MQLSGKSHGCAWRARTKNMRFCTQGLRPGIRQKVSAHASQTRMKRRPLWRHESSWECGSNQFRNERSRTICSGTRNYGWPVTGIAVSIAAPMRTRERCANGAWTKSAVHESASPKLMWWRSRKGDSAQISSSGRRNGQSLRNLSRRPGARKNVALSDPIDPTSESPTSLRKSSLHNSSWKGCIRVA